MIFKNFHEKSHYRYGDFQENRENSILGEFLKIRKWIFSQKLQFRLKNESLRFLGIQPSKRFSTGLLNSSFLMWKLSECHCSFGFICGRDKIWHDCYRHVMLRWLNIWNWLCFNCILRNEQFTQMIHIPVTMLVISSQQEVLKEQGITDRKDYKVSLFSPENWKIMSVDPCKEHL